MPDCGNDRCRAPLPAGFTKCPNCGAKYDKREPLTQLELANQAEANASVPVVNSANG